MGKATGFMEFKRTVNISVSPERRVRDFSEFHLPMDKARRREQAARCMNCGVPFCQSGVSFGGMISGCPLHNLIPEWNDDIYTGSWREALSRLLKNNPFPEFTGRVCPALCEAACTCGMTGLPVTVRDNELSIIEEGFSQGWVIPAPPTMRSGRRVAVIGSGPAGLATAQTLNRRGHSVVVFERDSRPGGLLMYGIPNMKLDKQIIERRVRLMEAEGVEFRCSTNVGADCGADDILNRFDATVLCCGSKTPRDLNVSGREADGVHYAVDYLSAAAKVIVGESAYTKIDAKNKNVVIVGGGDTGNDCVATAIRQGCRSVVQLEMMAKLPDARAPQNPWPQWPRVCKTDYGQEEAIALFGHDPRLYKTTVKEIILDDCGAVCSVTTVSVEQHKDAAGGRMVMGEVAGSERILPCELLIIAAGFIGCEAYVADAFGAERTARGCLNTAPERYATAIPGVFAAGDARRGQSLVVWAIAEGVACAKEVERYLER